MSEEKVHILPSGTKRVHTHPSLKGTKISVSKRPMSGSRRRIDEAKQLDSQIKTEPSNLIAEESSDGFLRAGSFSSDADLNEWLLRHGVCTLKWGVSQNKSVLKLFKELEEGDSALQISPVLRVTYVLRAKVDRVADSERFLVETHQQLGNGSYRQRNQVCCVFSLTVPHSFTPPLFQSFWRKRCTRKKMHAKQLYVVFERSWGRN